MTHRRLVLGTVLGAVTLVLATACAAVPAAPAGGHVVGVEVLGPTFDSQSVPAFGLFPAPSVNVMGSMSLSRAAEKLMTEQLYNAFYMGVGGCDRHHDLFLQEDLGASDSGVSGN